jgi:hypothetical protein
MSGGDELLTVQFVKERAVRGRIRCRFVVHSTKTLNTNYIQWRVLDDITKLFFESGPGFQLLKN